MPKVKQVKHPKHPQITINEKLPFPLELNIDDLLEKSRKLNINSSKPGKIPDNIPIYEHDYISIPYEVTQFSTQPQITQPQFNTNLASDSYPSLFDANSVIENSLIDFVYQTFNLLIKTTSPENYSKLFNVT